MRKFVIAVIEIILLTSAGYLIYMASSKDVKFGITFRFYVFALQHLYTFLMVLYNTYNYNQNPLDHINWLVAFTVGNFLQFGAAEIYLATQPDTAINFANKQLLYKDFGVLSYIHFYYQINIYFGVFSIFSIVMCTLFKIHQRNQREKMEEILQNLEESAPYATGNEQPCSICLTQYDKQEQIYKLHCSHLFHKECLKDWFKQKLTCPLCRSTTLYEGQDD